MKRDLRVEIGDAWKWVTGQEEGSVPSTVDTEDKSVVLTSTDFREGQGLLLGLSIKSKRRRSFLEFRQGI